MGGCISCEIDCSKSMYQSCCCCFAQHMSARKFLSVIPWAPIFCLLTIGIAGSFMLLGIEMICSSVGVNVTVNMIRVSQGAVLLVILIDLIFTYSVASNKLRIHNAHCNAEGCRGYRIKDGAGCCGVILRCFCKMYNVILQALSWFAMLIILVLTIIVSWFSGCSLFLVALCELSQPAIQTLLDRIMEVELISGGDSPLSDFVVVTNGTNASMVCDQSADITTGSLYVLIAGPIGLLAQIVMMLSFQIVASVSWRHMKDVRREEERAINGGETDIEMKRQQMANSRMCGGGGGSGGGSGGGGYSGGPACPYSSGPYGASGCENPYNTSGGPYAGSGPSAVGASFNNNYPTTENI